MFFLFSGNNNLHSSTNTQIMSGCTAGNIIMNLLQDPANIQAYQDTENVHFTP